MQVTYYSINEEDFPYQHPADAICDLLDKPKVGDVIWQCDFQPLTYHAFSDIPSVISEHVYQRLSDLVGEPADDYYIPDAKWIELKNFINRWISSEMGWEHYYTPVGAMTEYKITQEDIDDANSN